MKRIAAGCLVMALNGVAVAGSVTENKMNAWTADGGRLEFKSREMEVRAGLPLGFSSLKIKGGEFLQGGQGHGGMTFCRPDGTYVAGYTEVSNLSHDQSRLGGIADGMFLLQVKTMFSLPDFEIYAGFNDPRPHDLVLFMSDNVRALRVAPRGDALMNARQMVLRGGPAVSFKAREVAAVHENGAALRLAFPDEMTLGTLPGADGQPRLAITIPCKGMGANTVSCRLETMNGADALTVFPILRVDSPTMGQSDPGYKPQSCGYWALYEKGAQVDYVLEFGWLGDKAFPGRFVVESRHALGQPHFRLEAKAEKTGEAGGIAQYRATIRPQFTLPGVSDCNFHLEDGDGIVLWADRLRFLYDWQGYQPTYNMPPDLKAFWDGTLAELARIPLEPKVEKTLFKDDPDWEFQHVSFNGWEGKRIHACLYIPKVDIGGSTASDAGRADPRHKRSKPLPVCIAAHPGILGFGANHRADGVYGSQVKFDPRFVTIVPLIRGYEPDAKDIPFNQPWWGPLESRETHAARSWFTAMVRALDYLATRPELADMSRVLANGGSQGGALAVATAALDRRVKVCIADSPSNSMLSDAVRLGTYTSFGPTAGQAPAGQTLEQFLRTLSYFDPANLAPWIQCPTVIHLNVGDLTVHSMGGLGVYKNLTALPGDKKWFCPGVYGHAHCGSYGGKLYGEPLIQALVEGKK